MKKITIVLFLSSVCSIYSEDNIRSRASWIKPILKCENVALPLKIDKNLTTKHSVVIFYSDKNGKKFVSKEFTYPDFVKSSFAAIREAVASLVAESINAPISRARIVPHNINFPPRKLAKYATAVMNYVSGIMVLGNGYSFNIKQYLKGDCPQNEWGFSHHVIQGMAAHPDLAVIAAFDTFTCNNDRSKNNIIHDKQHNRFYGIDQELCFKLPMKRNIPKFSCDQIDKMIKKGIHFTPKEINALQKYCATLNKLIELNPPEKIFGYFLRMVTEAGLSPEGNVKRKKSDKDKKDKDKKDKDKKDKDKKKSKHTVAQQLKLYKEKITEQYEYSKKMVKLLERLIVKSKKIETRKNTASLW